MNFGRGSHLSTIDVIDLTVIYRERPFCDRILAIESNYLPDVSQIISDEKVSMNISFEYMNNFSDFDCICNSKEKLNRLPNRNKKSHPLDSRKYGTSRYNSDSSKLLPVDMPFFCRNTEDLHTRRPYLSNNSRPTRFYDMRYFDEYQVKKHLGKMISNITGFAEEKEYDEEEYHVEDDGSES
ncbi:hypothetical protein RF11_12363 [Thelohanellus kitauei]|uniref:Uncharacterized protein n=1 Tax=Thelohanellus kitauei TaxID=669202 RepID=A0A0C2MZV0_THEKT|nr:hypothetical protein RF11_12363 [Thelohanellus kitauei]